MCIHKYIRSRLRTMRVGVAKSDPTRQPNLIVAGWVEIFNLFKINWSTQLFNGLSWVEISDLFTTRTQPIYNPILTHLQPVFNPLLTCFQPIYNLFVTHLTYYILFKYNFLYYIYILNL